jgi:phosphate/sulfate permease
VNTLNAKKLGAIFCAWFLSPVISALLAMGIAFVLGVR